MSDIMVVSKLAEIVYKMPNLRDQFAAVALIGLLTNASQYRPDYQADRAYDYADAMMKEREK